MTFNTQVVILAMWRHAGSQREPTEVPAVLTVKAQIAVLAPHVAPTVTDVH